MERWNGKLAIVTGASSGMGAEIAKILVENGLQVVGLARRVDLITDLAKQLEGQPGKLHPFQADMKEEEDILKAFRFAINNFGAVHVLVNNAGIAIPNPLLTGTTKGWESILDVNVIGLCIATREAVKNMIKNDVAGHIVHINSILGHKPFAAGTMYGPSKYAVTSLTEVLRCELRDAKTKIKVTSISPGVTDTGITRPNGGDIIPQLKNVPILQAVDIANAVVYTLSTPPHVQVHELTIKPLGEFF